MKKIFTVALLVVAIFSFYPSLSQKLNNGNNNSTQAVSDILSAAYTFSYSTGTYTNLTGSTNLTGLDLWESNSYPCLIGFTFKFYNIPFDTIEVSDPNDIQFGYIMGRYRISAFGADMGDRGLGDVAFKPKSPISYLLDGTAPSRILKIEWKNAGFLVEINDTTIINKTNYINLQLWLYETSNNIEIHFGPHLVTHPGIIYEGTSGPNISLNNNVNSKYICLIGDSTKPTVSTIPEVVMNGTPPNGMIFKFATDYISIADKTRTNYSFYPNPVKEVMNVMLTAKSEWANVQIYNLLGKELLSCSFMHSSLLSLDVKSLPAGTYLLKLQTPETVITQKITKQ